MRRYPGYHPHCEILFGCGGSNIWNLGIIFFSGVSRVLTSPDVISCSGVVWLPKISATFAANHMFKGNQQFVCGDDLAGLVR